RRAQGVHGALEIREVDLQVVDGVGKRGDVDREVVDRRRVVRRLGGDEGEAALQDRDVRRVVGNRLYDTVELASVDRIGAGGRYDAGIDVDDAPLEARRADRDGVG